jgi:hypothetical protein
MQRIYLFLIFSIVLFGANAQQFEYRIGKQTYKVDSVYEQILAYENIGVKVTGTAAMDSAAEWLLERYESFGYTPIIDTFPAGSNQSYNIVVEKPGSEPNKWIIIGAHFDSDTKSPGANDNGSGVVATLEIARLIKDIDTKIGVRIVNFGAEEQGYIGSNHYVLNKLDLTEDIQLMINLDQLGGTKGADNSKIVCERDEDDSPKSNNAMSYLKTDTLGQLMAIYSNLTPVLGVVERSDYLAFEDKGLVVTGLYQESDYPHYHSSTDITANMDTEATTEVIKGALGAVLYFARIDIILSTEELETIPVRLFPNPASSSFTYQSESNEPQTIVLTNSLGQELINKSIEPNQPINVSMLGNGLYSVSIYNEGSAHKKYSKLIIAQ